MRPAGNLAGVEFIAPPRYHNQAELWAEIITESGYFFSKQAMAYFGSRVAWDSLTALTGEPRAYGFITSEQDKPFTLSNGETVCAWDGARRYTVRAWREDSGIITLSEFGQFESLKDARQWLTRGPAFAALRDLEAVA
jgi:hypothetical protein